MGKKKVNADDAPKSKPARAPRGKTAPSQANPTNPVVPDPVEEASDESFPASDPPSWTATTATKNNVDH